MRRLAEAGLIASVCWRRFSPCEAFAGNVEEELLVESRQFTLDSGLQELVGVLRASFVSA